MGAKIGITLLALGAIAAVAYLASCPCGRLPGLWLSGQMVSDPVKDWSFINEVPLCELQVNSWRPHAITLNCMSHKQAAYVSCSRCATKHWSTIVADNGLGRLKAGNALYPVRIHRVTQPGLMDAVWQARAQKLKLDPSARPDHWWTFALTSTGETQ